MKNVIREKWHWRLISFFLLVETVVLLLLGDNIYASAHDNLELHVLDYHLLRENGLFFAHGAELPVLNGVSRDYFFSEFNIYSVLFLLFPTCYAYIIGIILKTVVGVFCTRLLARDILKDNYRKYESLAALVGFAYGLLPLYPMFAIYFTSIPYLIWILRRVCKREKGGFTLLFTYPFFSYFTFFGMFILGYMALYAIYLALTKSKYMIKMLLSVVVLAVGYMVFEYRLFGIMLFSGTKTIRDTMVFASCNAAEFFTAVVEVFCKGIFHAESVHTYFVMPVVLLYLAAKLVNSMYRKNIKGFLKNPVLLMILAILFNCFVYGLFYLEPVRNFVAFLVPPVRGLQFNRTIFFNPFLWYAAFFAVLKQMYDAKLFRLSNTLAVAAAAVVLLSNTKYNDLFQTAINHTYEIVKQKEPNNLSYREYFSTELFDKIKEEIGYEGEKAVAYGLDPGVLAYNGISTLDGVLSYYPLSYKEAFRQVIAPALDREGNEAARVYYDDWGARAYLVSGSGESVSQPLRSYEVSDRNLYIDVQALRALDGVYVFSRIELENEDTLGIALVGTYVQKGLPYTIYLYQA
ncbi:hypothetical protein FMM75_16205 [Lachnospiraceae bacterium MD335]|nr:hypothetical protein [Lachnospiraceae bacterium MD335]